MASSLLVCHPSRPFSVDATTLGVSEADLDALPWARVAAAMRDLEAGGIANPDEKRQVGHYWLRAPERAPTVRIGQAIGETVEAVTTFADAVRAGAVGADGRQFTDVLHVGIGGSALGPNLVVDALADGEGLRVTFVDNTDPDGIERILRRLGDRLASTLVVVVSKSGGTPETANGAKLVVDRLIARGLSVGPRMVAITQEGSVLDRQAVAERWLRRFPMWDWVGGRVSVTAAVGLLPGALAGVDVHAFLRGARDMDDWTRQEDWRSNPAALLAGGWHVVGGGRGDRNMVVLPYSDRLVLLSRYLQQVVMESLGKKLDLKGREVHQGISVYGNKGSTDQHAYVQQLRDGRNDFFVQFVQVLSDGIGSAADVGGGATAGDYLQGFLLGTRQALRDEGRPSAVVTLPEVSAYELGAVVALFERAVGLYGSLVGINAYHQPGVEAGKSAAKAVLDIGKAVRAAVGSEWRSADELAAAAGADPNVVFHLLEKLAATGRIARRGSGGGAVYRTVT
ncbi:MAG: glucose-6-phosphate isomerase [Myxococcota bacterium]